MAEAVAEPLTLRPPRAAAGGGAGEVAPTPHFASRLLGPLWPVVLTVVSAAAFVVVQPSVGDLQAALARQSAAAHGVGLTYWFSWFGGGTTPGSYSVLTPYLSTLLGAPLLGALATVISTPLVAHALAGTRHRTAGVWLATLATGCDLWSGRVPFALGVALALVAAVALRRRLTVLAVAATVLSGLCSPVSGAFIALAVFAVFVTDRSRRRSALLVASAGVVALLVPALTFGDPGAQTYHVGSMLFTLVSAGALLSARPAPVLRTLLWLVVVAAPLLWLVPNGLGANVVRLPWMCLPAAVYATADAGRTRRVLAVLPALTLCVNATVVDLARSTGPSAAPAYYASLIGRLTALPDLRNHRLEVVDDPDVHTAAYAVAAHAALAGGWESQAFNRYDKVLLSAALDAGAYRRWLDDNAVGYVALDRRAQPVSPELRLVRQLRPGYLVPVASDAQWVVFRVAAARPIVSAPARLVAAGQASMTIDVPCACIVPVRVRYSTFLHASSGRHRPAATVTNDGHGWTRLRTRAPGRYVLRGSLFR